MNYDYKEILRKKASTLSQELYKYSDRLSDEERNSIEVLIDNTFEITNGRLDALDYDVRDKAIMNYHNKLDEAINILSKFKPVKDKDNVIE